MELWEQDKFLREYKLKDKISIYYSNDYNSIEKISSIIKESTNKLFGKDFIPLNNLLLDKKESIEYIEAVLKEYFNQIKNFYNEDIEFTYSNIKNKIGDILDKEFFEELGENYCIDINKCFIESCVKNNYSTYTNYNKLIKIIILPIFDKFLIHFIFDITEKFDYILLIEKFISLIDQVQLDIKVLDWILYSSKNIFSCICSIQTNNIDNDFAYLFLNNAIDGICDNIINSKKNSSNKKHVLLFKLFFHIKNYKRIGYSEYKNVIDIDLEFEFDKSQILGQDYTEAQRICTQLITMNLLKQFDCPIDDLEKIFIYYCMFIISYNMGAYKRANQFGNYLLEDNKLVKNYKRIKWLAELLPNSNNLDSLIKRYDNTFHTYFFSCLLDSYIKDKDYINAYYILSEYPATSSIVLYNIIKDDDNFEFFNEILITELEKDICELIVPGYSYLLNYDKRDALMKWNTKITKDNIFVNNIYIPIQKHLLNILLVLFMNKRYLLTNKLLNFMKEYFYVNEESYKNFYYYIVINSDYIEQKNYEFFLIIKNAEEHLAKFKKTDDVKQIERELIIIKNKYARAGKILNDFLLEEKMKSLSEVLYENLDKVLYSEIIDDVIAKMKPHFKPENISKEEMSGYYDKLKSEEMLGSIWTKLEDVSKTHFATGLFLYDIQKILGDDVNQDYSPTIISWCLALENELKLKFYKPFIAYCRNNKIKIDPKKVKTKQLTFGLFTVIYKSELKKVFIDFCNLKYSKLKNNELEVKINEISEQLEIARDNYRNKSAHPGILNYKEADDCFDLFFPTRNLIKSILDDYDIL